MNDTAQKGMTELLAWFEAANWRRTDMSLLPSEHTDAEMVRDNQWNRPFNPEYFPENTPRKPLGRSTKFPVGVPLRGLVAGRHEGGNCRMFVPDLVEGRVLVYAFAPHAYHPENGVARMKYDLEMASVLLSPENAVTIAPCSLSAEEMFLLLANPTIAGISDSAHVLINYARITPMIAPFAADGARMAQYLNAQVEREGFKVLSCTPLWFRRYTQAGPSKYGQRRDQIGLYNYDGLGWAVHVVHAASGASIEPQVLVDGVGNFVISSWCQREGKGGTSNEAYHGRDVPHTLKTWLLGAYTIRLAQDGNDFRKQIKTYVPPKFIPAVPTMSPGMTPLMNVMLKRLRMLMANDPQGIPNEVVPNNVYPRLHHDGVNRVIVLNKRDYVLLTLNADGVIVLKPSFGGNTDGLISTGLGVLSDYGFSPADERELYDILRLTPPPHLTPAEVEQPVAHVAQDNDDTDDDAEEKAI